jgi:hypothetical protein
MLFPPHIYDGSVLIPLLAGGSASPACSKLFISACIKKTIIIPFDV